MAIFFCPCGKKTFSKEEFIDFYSEKYYLTDSSGKPNEPVTYKTAKGCGKVGQSSRYVENEIDRLLEKGIKEKIDVVRIMAWKIGKIDHRKSNDEFAYVSGWEGAKDWDGNPDFTVTRYGKEIKIGKLATYIADNINELENLAKENPQEVLNKLKKLNISGLGPVYLITLLYFISHGKYPIYDRFAMAALEAINDSSKRPEDEVAFHALPDKSSKKFETIIGDEMDPYINRIENIFGKAYWKNRDIDRALWVYGHLFKEKTTKTK